MCMCMHLCAYTNGSWDKQPLPYNQRFGIPIITMSALVFLSVHKKLIGIQVSALSIRVQNHQAHFRLEDVQCRWRVVARDRGLAWDQSGSDKPARRTLSPPIPHGVLTPQS